jgi:hypothetical protein
MILADYTPDDPYLKRLAGLSDQLSYTLCYFSRQHLIPVFRHPDEVVLYLKDCMAAVPVLHNLLPVFKSSIAAKADRLKPVVLTF